jgi:hypothetical protein
MDREAFDIYVETQLSPTLAPGDVVILDNPSIHKSAKAEAVIRAKGRMDAVPAAIFARP